MFAISPLTLQEVRAEWGWIRNGLLEVIGRCHERWSPEDAWTAVQAGTAFIWRIEGAGDDLGFILLRRDMDVDGPALFLWAIWCEPGSMAKIHREVFGRIVELAQRIGAKRIRMESSRKGWAGADYFVERSRIYEHEVT